MAFFTWDKPNDRQVLDAPPVSILGDQTVDPQLDQNLISTKVPPEADSAAYSEDAFHGTWVEHGKLQLILPTTSWKYRSLKRIFDLVVSILLLPMLGVLLIIIGSVVALTSGTPVFYRQHRLGQHGKTFRIFKFRTMRNNADQALAEWLLHHPELRQEWQRTHKLKRDPRITGLGRFLRDTSLDEIPQILNVLRGEMSLVGPRPIVQAERAKYADRYAYYSAAVPGVTGVWQVSGRCNVSYEDRVRMDEDYVRNWSLLRDVKILLRTPRSVIRRDGAC